MNQPPVNWRQHRERRATGLLPPPHAHARSASTSNALRGWAAAAILVIGCFGYQALAPVFQLVAGEDQLPSILMRGLVVGCSALLIVDSLNRGADWKPFWPMLLFMSAFSARLYENYFIRSLDLYMDADRMFLMWAGGAVIPAIALMLNGPSIDKKKTFSLLTAMGALFILCLTIQDQELFASGTNRASLDKLNPISLGTICLVFCCLSALRFFNDRRPFHRVVYAMAFVYLLGIAIFTASRGPFVAIVLALVTLALIAPGKHRWAIIGGSCALLAAGLAVSLILDVNVIAPLASRLSGIFSGSGDAAMNSVAARELAWAASIEQFKNHPLVGDVIFERALDFYPHQMILESLISVGLVGTLLLLAHLVVLLKATSTILHKKGLPEDDAFYVITCWFLFFGAQFSGSFATNGAFWLMSVVVIARGYHLRKGTRQPHARLARAGHFPADRRPRTVRR